jgi:hypothetical protein
MSELLLKEINKEISDFKNRDITIVPGYTHNQYEVLNRVYYYNNSKFTEQGSTLDPRDDEGDRMYFHNINKNPCKVFTKAIDFDTKNIKLLTTGGGDPLKTWYMERDLKYWMRDKQFGKVLNRLFKELPIYGSVVLKIIKGQPYFVDLRNFVVEQSADTLDDSNYIIEIHNYTVAGFRKAAKEMGWDKVEECIKKFYEMKGISHIRVYERYGVVAETNEKGESTYTNRRVFIADVGVDEFDQKGELKAEHPGVLLSSVEWDEHPYYEFHAEKIPGRWLGIGVVETLFEPQIRHNELANLQSKASHWLALHLFYTTDPNFNRNMSTDAKNGETFNVDSSIQEVVISDRNGAHFNDEYRKWLSNRDELTFSYDSVQGERSPAGTTASEIQSNVAQNLTYFQQIQEDVALDVKEMLYAEIIPSFQDENSKEHTIRLVGQDLDMYAEMIKNDLTMKELIRLSVNTITGQPWPSSEDKETIGMAVTEAIKQGKERIITIPRDFYKNLKYDVEIDITGESVDTRVRAATKFALLQAMTADPTMTTDPMKRKILFSYAEDAGINPNDLLSVPQSQPMMEMGRAGGGVSTPQLANSVPGAVSSTV